jgi:diguanylate cyclase (GGDEF)-like protein
VANRAEFDRVHTMFIEAHQRQQVPCSLIICDLDRFKLVNDTYGHQAGDDAIKSLASLLKTSCRPGDLVARYGGEEFVVLCADCDNAAATRRAEQIRTTLALRPQPKLNGKPVTASFGVTEIQPGDTPETMLRRADRALLIAKARGRNNVVQLGTGGSDFGELQTALAQPQSNPKEQLLEQDLITPVPVKIAVEKLRGFVADHQAKIVSVNGNEVRLEIDGVPEGRTRRFGDRPVGFVLDLHLEEERGPKDDQDQRQATSTTVRTRIHVAIAPRKNRDRRRSDVNDRARDVLLSFRSYLMASDNDTAPGGMLSRVKRMLPPWMAGS